MLITVMNVSDIAIDTARKETMRMQDALFFVCVREGESQRREEDAIEDAMEDAIESIVSYIDAQRYL